MCYSRDPPSRNASVTKGQYTAGPCSHHTHRQAGGWARLGRPDRRPVRKRNILGVESSNYRHVSSSVVPVQFRDVVLALCAESPGCILVVTGPVACFLPAP